MSKEIAQSEFWISILTEQLAISIVILNVHPKVQSNILMASHPLASTNFNIISGAV